MRSHLVDIGLTCNGKSTRMTVPADRLLVDLLRENLQLTGTKLGCGTGDCGACTVLLDGASVCSCIVFAAEADHHEIQTIESVAETQIGRAVVEAFVDNGAVQCGICTPGLVVAAVGLLSECTDVPSTATIKEGLAGNLCRCTGYYPIVRAVIAAAETISALRRGSS